MPNSYGITYIVRLLRNYFVSFCTQLYGIKYSFQILIICTHLYGWMYFYLILITIFVSSKYFYLIIVICTESVSSWCNSYCPILRNHSKRVRTPLSLLRSISDKFYWKSYGLPYLLSYGLNSSTAVLLERQPWH